MYVSSAKESEINYRNGQLTFLGTLSQVFFIRKIGALVKAAHIWRTPLKLCKHLQISATAVHFSMAATRAAILHLYILFIYFFYSNRKRMNEEKKTFF